MRPPEVRSSDLQPGGETSSARGGTARLVSPGLGSDHSLADHRGDRGSHASENTCDQSQIDHHRDSAVTGIVFGPDHLILS